jgi:phosphoglycolate phosphatase
MHRKYDTVLFDLDGTLTDSAPGITKSVQYALQKMGLEVPDYTRLTGFVGPPLAEGFRDYCGFSDEECAQAVAHFRVRFTAVGIFENAPYDGVENMLKTLTENGLRLMLATSKPEIFARQILERFSLSGYFEKIAGATLDGTRVEKADVIEHLLEGCETDRSRAVMVGDRRFDADGAAACGLSCIGVLYGYGVREEFLGSNVTALAQDVGELTALLLAEEPAAQVLAEA